MNSSAIDNARNTYNIDYWGEGYFDINAQGEVLVRPKRGAEAISLNALRQRIEATTGLTLPVLVRFNDILRDRVCQLQAAFTAAISHYQYEGDYTAVYPIKVNQQRLVIEEMLTAGGDGFGLECGSKPELLAVLSVLREPGQVAICNGYKDKEYIRLALLARKLGYNVYIIIEKQSELDIILQQAKELAVQPLLGVRVRLAAVASGKWQNSGGDKSKFGLTAKQLLDVVAQLKQHQQQASLQMLHVHLGSQIANIRDIQIGLKEVARFYAELHQLGITIEAIDVGGGLGVDYEGTRSRRTCSMNYTLAEYANTVVGAFVDMALATGLPQPRLLSESGRALSAHHAILLTNTINTEIIPEPNKDMLPVTDDAPMVLQELWQAYQAVGHKAMLETYHDAVYRIAEVQSMYNHGLLSLAQRAQAEEIHQALCMRIRLELDPHKKPHRELLDELNAQLADKLFVNFSIFQSMPDIWAIDQIFPIMPLTGLTKPLSRRAVVQDLTCDSDGRVEYYIDGQSLETTLPLPAQAEPYYLAFFLVGAYQEILGDMHNLFGDTASVHVELDSKGDYQLVHAKAGDHVADVLDTVNFNQAGLLQAYREKLLESNLTASDQVMFLQELTEGLAGYTYLED
jgi:arginine decarboxylase